MKALADAFNRRLITPEWWEITPPRKFTSDCDCVQCRVSAAGVRDVLGVAVEEGLWN